MILSLIFLPFQDPGLQKKTKGKNRPPRKAASRLAEMDPFITTVSNDERHSYWVNSECWTVAPQNLLYTEQILLVLRWSLSLLILLQTLLLCLIISDSSSSPGLLSFFVFHHFHLLSTSLHPLTICLPLIKISKIQMAAGWLLSGNLPLIITGGAARRSVGLAETNGKLDFFTELEWGVGIHILTSHQRAVDQDKCFGLVGEGGSKLSLMLRGILIRFP